MKTTKLNRFRWYFMQYAFVYVFCTVFSFHKLSRSMDRHSYTIHYQTTMENIANVLHADVTKHRNNNNKSLGINLL